MPRLFRFWLMRLLNFYLRYDKDDKKPTALFFNCASHILNFVINELNTASEVRNTTGATKSIIIFLESVRCGGIKF